MPQLADASQRLTAVLFGAFPCLLAEYPHAQIRPKLTLTPEMLENAYEYLRVSPPFRAWNLPHADQVMFRVMGTRDRFGHFRGRHAKATGNDGFSEIAISAGMVKSTDLLIVDHGA